jgi:hypothetical protein
MKRTLIITFFLCVFNALNAQKQAIYFNPLPLLSLSHMNLEFGYAREFRNGFRSNFGVGIIVPPDLWNGDKFHDVGRKKGRGFLLHFEPKYAFPFAYRSDIEYILTLKTSIFVHNYQFKRYLDTTLKTINFDVKTKGFMVNLLFGTTTFSYDNLFGEMTFGMGVRGIHVDNNSPIPIAQMYNQIRLTALFEPEEKGNYLRFKIMFNYKIGLAF